MPDINLMIQAKALNEAFLAQRIITILKRAVEQQASIIDLTEEEKSVISKGITLIISSHSGFKATQAIPSGSGFTSYLDSLNCYQSSFSAMVQGELVTSQEDIPAFLDVVKNSLEEISQSKVPASIDRALNYFKALDEVRSRDAKNLSRSPRRKMPSLRYSHNSL